MKVLYATSEAAPFVKTGGLGDVGASFPPALAQENVSVRVILPLYESIAPVWREQMHFVMSMYVRLSWRSLYCGLFELTRGSVTYYFLDNEYYFKRRELYGHYDDGERFAFFSKAVLDILPELGWKPDVIHCNDWQTALIPIYLRSLKNSALDGIRTVFTIHNIEYQGRFGREIMADVFGLPETLVENGTLEFMGGVSLMKGALLLSDRITTVSPTYAKELSFAYYAHGLEGVVAANAHKLTGILNGIDQTLYDPETDANLEEKFSRIDLSGKAKNKRALERLLHLNESEQAPVVAIVSRLVSHKGMDLITAMLGQMMELPIQLVVLGRGDWQYEQQFLNAQSRYPGRVSANILYSASLAMKIYAGADIFLMPSQAEPCGLSQMIAMRYGAVPVVRETGGLRDTVPAYDETTGAGSGFTFENYNAHDMLEALTAACRLYADKERWQTLSAANMAVDFSWGRSARAYRDLFEELAGDGDA